MCFNPNPSGFTIAWCSGATHTNVSLTAPPVAVYADVDVVGCSLHLDLKAVCFAKHAGWIGYTTGMVVETLPQHGCKCYPLLSQHVGSLFLFPAPFPSSLLP